MLKIAVVGSTGMVGSMIFKYLWNTNTYQIAGISRVQVDIEKELLDLERILEVNNPDLIINCIGLLVKPCEKNPSRAIYLNSFFPHWLSENFKAKIIHISSDCIFNGKKGFYSEDAMPDETNWYGRTKFMGELNNQKDLTIRTSVIGPELLRKTGLLEWTLQQKQMEGYVNVLWNGVTTLELVKFIHFILVKEINLTGIYHLSSAIISKFNLVKLIAEVFEKNIELIPVSEPRSNKTLVNNRFSETRYISSVHGIQLRELHSFITKNDTLE